MQNQMPATLAGRGDLPVGPFRSWLRGYLSRYETRLQAATRLGEHERTLSRVLLEQRTVHLAVVDRILVAAGESPTVLNELYPLDDAVAVQP
jgi:hypothetical protein